MNLDYDERQHPFEARETLGERMNKPASEGSKRKRKMKMKGSAVNVVKDATGSGMDNRF